MKNTLILLGMLALTPQLKAQLLLEALDAPDSPNPLIQSKCIERVKDKYYGDGDHNFIYCTVMGPNGKKWLNLNLGAVYAKESSPHFNPEAQPTNYNDWKAFGSLFQDGRNADGHELVEYVHRDLKNNAHSGIMDYVQKSDHWYVYRKYSPISSSQDPLNAGRNYIIGENDDWSAYPNVHPQLWDGEMLNNPCPNGYRIMNGDDIQSLLVTDKSKIRVDTNQGFTTPSIFTNLDFPNLTIVTAPTTNHNHQESQGLNIYDPLQVTLSMSKEGSTPRGTSSLWILRNKNQDTYVRYIYDNKNIPIEWKFEQQSDNNNYSYNWIFDRGVFISEDRAYDYGYGNVIKGHSVAIRCVEK